jgi:hypothetical protein
MKKLLLRFLITGVFVCLSAVAANAQIKSIPLKTLKVTKDVAVIVVGGSARLTAKAAQATGPILLKTTEKTAVFMLKQAKNMIIKAVIPAGRQLIVKYLKYRLMP